MNDLRGVPDALAVTSDISLAIAVSAGLDELLPWVARRVAEVFDVSECRIYEYRRDVDTLVSAARWTADAALRDCEWRGTTIPVGTRPSYRRLVSERGVGTYHVDDGALDPEERRLMEECGERSVFSLPLVLHDEVVGALSLVEKRAPRRLDADEVRRLELMAVPIAVSLHNARMFRREAEQKRRLGALLSASRAMTSTIDLDELLASIARAAREALEAGECAISTYDAETDVLTVVACALRTSEADRAQRVGQSCRLADYPADGRILAGGTIVETYIDGATPAAHGRPDVLEGSSGSLLSVPLIDEGRPIGLLVFVEAAVRRHFSSEERELAAALGEQAAAAIHHAQLLRRSERQNRELGLLLESTRAISSSVDLDEVLDTVARAAAELLGSEECQIQEYDTAASTVRPVALWQRRPDALSRQSLGRSFSLEAHEIHFIDAKEVLEQRRSDPNLPRRTRDAFLRFGDRSYLNVPLVFNDESVGVLVLVEKERERHWTHDEVALAKGLAEQAAVAIEHARLYKRVQDEAITDGLTGLYNHRFFYERLDQEIARARRYGTPVSLLMIDLDDFKDFNDCHGHLAGDAVLRLTADVLRSELRQSLDIAARYGGEELAVILPNTPIAAVPGAQMEMDLAGKLTRLHGPDEPPPPGHRGGAEQVAERIRRRIGETQCDLGDGMRLALPTVSIGVAVYPERTNTPEDLVAHADAALYVAKRAGKDRVETYG